MQPAFIFIILLELVCLIFLTFGVSIEVEQGSVVAISILNSRMLEVMLFVNQMLPPFIGLVMSALTFLYIMIYSTVYPDLLNSSLLGVILTKSKNRRGLFLDEFLGGAAAGCLDSFVFFILVSLILSAKTGIIFLDSAFLGAALFSIMLIVLLSLSALFGILGGNDVLSAILVLAIYFVLSPLILLPGDSGSTFVKAASLIIPSTQSIYIMVQDVVVGKSCQLVEIVQPVIVAALCLFASVLVFERKDF